MTEKKELSLGREITKEIVGDVCGFGAGTLVGGLLTGVVASIPGIGKPLSVVLKVGIWGIQVKTLLDVRERVGEYTETVFDAVDSVKAMINGPKKVEENKVQVEGAVE